MVRLCAWVTLLSMLQHRVFISLLTVMLPSDYEPFSLRSRGNVLETTLELLQLAAVDMPSISLQREQSHLLSLPHPRRGADCFMYGLMILGITHT